MKITADIIPISAQWINRFLICCRGRNIFFIEYNSYLRWCKCRDNGRTRQKYCCPFKNSKTSCCPCNHKCWNNGKKNRGCTKYVTVPDDYRLSIDRQSIAFKSVYALRTEAERYNSRFKQAGCERVFVRNGNSTKNLNTIAHISLLSIAITAVITKKSVSYRSTKSVKRIA